MKHDIPIETLGPTGPAMAQAVANCVHCGFCLPVCPTYQVLGEEMDSPRGRIFLMKETLEGKLDLEETLPYVDRCLGCQACVTACPSGVQYGELLAPFRDRAERMRSRDLTERASRLLIQETLPYPQRFRAAVTLGKAGRPFQNLLPQEFRGMLEMLPASVPNAQPLPAIYPVQGKRRARVALLAGCVQQVLAPEINWATLRVLARNGVEVVIPLGQSCCGALALHTGEMARARALARTNLALFPQDVDAIVTNAAGCGSGMHEYPLLFKGQPEQEQAETFAHRVQDITVFLDTLGISPPPLPQPLTVAYHDACHLAHAQGVTAPPRTLLQAIPNLTLVEIADGGTCCGSAGTYNLEQPEIARELGRRKAQNILDSGAHALATGNIGCLTQIQSHLAQLGSPLPLYHTVQILDRAYQAIAE